MADNLSKIKFKQQKKLDKNIWTDDLHLKNSIKTRLYNIATDFIQGSLKELKIKSIKIKDIVITGSIANYNWDDQSDIDLHIIFDFKQIDDNMLMAKEMTRDKTAIWNSNHEIMIQNHEVEIYFQDVSEKHTSSGIYSIVDNKWIKIPAIHDIKIDKDEILNKTDVLIRRIDFIEQDFKGGDYEEAFVKAEKMKKQLRAMRMRGLDSQLGEYSKENLIFKVLRRSGYLKKLSNIKNKAYDESMSS